MFSVTKEVYFCYGHRLMNHSGKCRHIHGHSVKAAVTVEAQELDAQGMVCDFSDIQKVAQQYIDNHFDHTLLLHKDDPIIPLLETSGEKFMALDQHPTAEVLAKLLFQHIQAQGFKVSQVILWETSCAYACYQEKTVA